jgi:hypothetical protein
MIKNLAIFLGVLAMILLMPRQAAAFEVPIVLSTTVDYNLGTLTISGRNLGRNPVVTLENENFPTVMASDSQIVANFPASTPPSSFKPGTYFLVLQYKGQLPSVFTVDLGSIGAQGPQGVVGPAGAQGLPGSQGAQGPMGAIGAQGPLGPPGPVGPAGAAGVMGPTGAMGAQGPAGSQGTPGVAGATGPAGPAGDGLPATCALDDVVVFYNGAWQCKSALPRWIAINVTDSSNFVDSVVMDNQTGLMWQVESNYNLNQQLNWTRTTPFPDGNIFTNFLPQLNDGEYYDPTAYVTFASQNLPIGLLVQGNPSNPTSCFANRCDWRIPTLAELRTIVYRNEIVCTLPGYACINPIFGATQASIYWTSSSDLTAHANGSADEAYCVDFSTGHDCEDLKTAAHYVRAVRTAH